MDAAAPPPPFPAGYSKFHSALNAGLLNPLSPPPPPLDKIRSSPTLFEMMANEQDCHPRHQTQNQNQIQAQIPRHHPPLSAPDRQLLLQDRVASILSSCSPGNLLGDQSNADVKLSLSSRDGLSISMAVHRHVLVAHSRFFAAKLSDLCSKHHQNQIQRHHHVIEISDCDDVEVYVETLRLMYSCDLRRRLIREPVLKVLSILKVSAAIGFDEGVLACLEYLEAAPWAEDEEEKVAALLSELRLDNSSAGEVLKRVSLELVPQEQVLVRLLHVVLDGKDEKARREMKKLVSKMLRENASVLGRDSLYSACDSILLQLRRGFLPAAEDQIARHAGNLHWLLEILIDRQLAEDLLRTWAAEADLAAAHSLVPAVLRHEVSRVTAAFLVGIGKGKILVEKEARLKLLQTWLEPLYEDFGWMRRACKGMDRHLVEEGLANTILTLPLALQQDILLNWFDRFLDRGDDCPNIQRGFEVWWRRAFWKRVGEEEPRQLRIVASGDPS